MARTVRRKLPRSIAAAIDAAPIIGIRAGSAADHRFIGIWAIVINGRVFARSWKQSAGGWYRTFMNDPHGAIEVAGRQIRVRAVPVRSERIRDELEQQYAQKYPTRGSAKYVRGFRSKRRRGTTVEFVPA
jgi:hypothetical protein